MLTDALHDLIRDIGDDSSPEHKAIFHLWSALDELNQAYHFDGIDRAFEAAAKALETSRTEGRT